MSKPEMPWWLPLAAFGALVVAGLIFGLWFPWYQAGMQVAVYERQGIHMTQWEVYMGIQPAERVIQIKERQ